MIDESKDWAISEVSLSCSNKNERQYILWCHSSKCGWQKLKALKVILSASSIFFNKQLVNNWNPHLLIFMRKNLEWKSHVTLIYNKKKILKETRWSPLWYLSLEYNCSNWIKELLGKQMKSKEEVKNKVCMDWISTFCKESQCNYVHTDEDIWRYSKCRDLQGQTRTDRDIQG